MLINRLKKYCLYLLNECNMKNFLFLVEIPLSIITSNVARSDQFKFKRTLEGMLFQPFGIIKLQYIISSPSNDSPKLL